MDKALALEKISKTIARCRECKRSKSGKPVPGEGNPDSDIVFLGEAPGRTEAQTGRPFVGRSGQLLRKLIRQSGLQEKDVYITSPVKYLPDRGTPTKRDIKHGRIHLARQLAVIEPEIIVLLGATAAYAMLGRVVPVLKEHGTVVVKDGRKYFITIHPAAVVRFPKYTRLMLGDFEKLSRHLA